MNRIKKTIISAVLSLCMTLGIFVSSIAGITAIAGMTNRIAFSDPTATAGENFQVTMKIYALSGGTLGGAKVMLSYDSEMIEFVDGTNAEGGAGSVKITGLTTTGQEEWDYTLNFKALRPGTTTISVADSEITDSDAQLGTVEKMGSSTITITGSADASSSTDLSSLKISPGILVPEFSAAVTEYTTIVGEAVDKITVSAPTVDTDAKVVITGNSELQMGENTVICKVTGADGSETKVYTIVVTKQEGYIEPAQTTGSSTSVNVNGIEYEVASSFDAALLPEGFTQGSVNYGGSEVMCATDSRNLSLIYLLGSDGSGDFFIYDASTDTWSPYAQINVAEKSVTVIPLPSGVEVPDGFTETTLALNGKKVKGWVWSTDTDQKYCIVYGMNQDGACNFYRYDMSEKTIQRYFADPALNTGISEDEYTEVVNKHNDVLQDYDKLKLITMVLGVAAVVLFIILIIVLIVGRRKNDAGEQRSVKDRRTEKYDSYDDEDYEEQHQIRNVTRITQNDEEAEEPEIQYNPIPAQEPVEYQNQDAQQFEYEDEDDDFEDVDI